MRYQIGQKIIVGFHEIDNKPVQSFAGNMFAPWTDRLKKLHLVELTCVEHHKVGWAHDPTEEKKYDGYVFQDKNGRRWANQYPHANYGQISTDSDYYFRLETGEYGGLTDTLYVFEDITVTIDRLSRGIRDIAEQKQEDLGPQCGGRTPKELVAMLEHHRTYVIKKIEKTFGAKVEIKAAELGYADGRPPSVHPEIQVAELIYNNTPATA